MNAPRTIACAHCALPVSPARQTADGPQFCCFGCHMVHGLRQAGETDGQGAGPGQTALMLRIGGGIFLTMNIMVFSYFFYSREIWDAEAGEVTRDYTLVAGLLSHLLLLLCTGVIVLLGVPLAADALARSRRGIDANLLIMIGVAAAYALSALHTFRGEGSLYYDTAAMILLLVTIGSYLDSGAKRRAMLSAEALIESAPTEAWVRRDGAVIALPANEVRTGDRLRIRAGERVPVDGVVVEGDSHVDESTMTGESQPRAVERNAEVLAGSVNIDGLLWIDATRVGEDRTIAQMRRLLEKARSLQPAVQKLADAIASVFVPLVIALSLAVFGWHTWRGEPAVGVMTALSVLLISCPCALGLSAPLASWCALTRAARRGILIDSGATLERAAGIRRAFFDKTGTLTTGTMSVTRIEPAPDCTADHALSIAAAIESASTHPVARAIVSEGVARGLTAETPQRSAVLPGRGIEATINGESYRIGSRRLIESAAADAAGETSIYLLRGDRLMARFVLRETVRPDAAAALHRLKSMGIECQMLTGDQPSAARRVADELGLTYQAAMLPEEKLARLQQAGKSAAMVGDGLNDAPCLAAADVGIAVAGGTDLARQAGNIHLLSDQLDRVPEVFTIARHAMRRIRTNLAWAFGYNIIGITLATMGMLSPIFAASAMVGSSLFVIANSRRA